MAILAAPPPPAGRMGRRSHLSPGTPVTAREGAEGPNATSGGGTSGSGVGAWRGSTTGRSATAASACNADAHQEHDPRAHLVAAPPGHDVRTIPPRATASGVAEPSRRC
jgi:hypothetical protein